MTKLVIQSEGLPGILLSFHCSQKKPRAISCIWEGSIRESQVFQLDHLVDISLYLTEATALRHFRDLADVSSWTLKILSCHHFMKPQILFSRFYVVKTTNFKLLGLRVLAAPGWWWTWTLEGWLEYPTLWERNICLLCHNLQGIISFSLYWMISKGGQ